MTISVLITFTYIENGMMPVAQAPAGQRPVATAQAPAGQLPAPSSQLPAPSSRLPAGGRSPVASARWPVADCMGGRGLAGLEKLVVPPTHKKR